MQAVELPVPLCRCWGLRGLDQRERLCGRAVSRHDVNLQDQQAATVHQLPCAHAWRSCLLDYPCVAPYVALE